MELELSPMVMAELRLLIPIAVAALFSGMIGFERERADKAAGLRTHILVGVTSALFVGLASIWIDQALASDIRRLQIDPIRALQAIAIGVGFLGSGIVFVDESKPRGLTTAASVWATAAVGAACGYSRFILAVGVTIIVLLTLRVLRKFDISSATRHSAE